MKYLIMIGFLVFGLILLGFSYAYAQSSMCGSYKKFVIQLENQYQEASIGKGVSRAGQIVIELFVSKDTFTVLASSLTMDRTCIIAAGKGWQVSIPSNFGKPI